MSFYSVCGISWLALLRSDFRKSPRSVLPIRVLISSLFFVLVSFSVPWYSYLGYLAIFRVLLEVSMLCTANIVNQSHSRAIARCGSIVVQLSALFYSPLQFCCNGWWYYGTLFTWQYFDRTWPVELGSLMSCARLERQVYWRLHRHNQFWLLIHRWPIDIIMTVVTHYSQALRLC